MLNHLTFDNQLSILSIHWVYYVVYQNSAMSTNYYAKPVNFPLTFTVNSYDELEGDWLANWTWDDSFESNEGAAAFVYNVSKGNFTVALKIVIEWLTFINTG